MAINPLIALQARNADIGGSISRGVNTASQLQSISESKARVETENANREREKELVKLRQAAMGGDREALSQVFALDPDSAKKVFDQIGATSDFQREDAARRASELLALPFEQRRSAILSQAQELDAQGRDPKDTLSLLQLSEEDQNRALNTVEMAALNVKERREARSPETFTPVRDESGRIIGQQSNRTGKVVSDPRAQGSGTIKEVVIDGTPGFARFFDDGRVEPVRTNVQPPPRGKGISLSTNPDGTFSLNVGGQGSNLTAAQRSKNEQAAITAEESIAFTENIADVIDNAISEAPDTIGLAGIIQSGISTALSNQAGALTALGVPKELARSLSLPDSEVRTDAAARAKLRSIQRGLVFVVASSFGQEGRALSDEDRKRFEQMVGLNASDDAAIRGALQGTIEILRARSAMQQAIADHGSADELFGSRTDEQLLATPIDQLSAEERKALRKELEARRVR